MIAVSLVAVAADLAALHATKLGLGLRAAARQPARVRLVGRARAAMLALGWGLAACSGRSPA